MWSVFNLLTGELIVRNALPPDIVTADPMTVLRYKYSRCAPYSGLDKKQYEWILLHCQNQRGNRDWRFLKTEDEFAMIREMLKDPYVV